MHPNLCDEQQQAAHLQAAQSIWQITVTFLVIITMIITLLNTNDPESYHTSILSGQGWMDELPWRPSRPHLLWIGVRVKYSLSWLISVLHNFGYGSPRYIDIEEQLSIFLYMSVTGLTIWHTSEWFQQSNDTISKYFCCMLGIFSTEPFYTMYINLPDAHTPLSQKICNNPKMSPLFDHALDALDGCHISCTSPSYSHPPYRNHKGFLSQNCLFCL